MVLRRSVVRYILFGMTLFLPLVMAERAARADGSSAVDLDQSQPQNQPQIPAQIPALPEASKSLPVAISGSLDGTQDRWSGELRLVGGTHSPLAVTEWGGKYGIHNGEDLDRTASVGGFYFGSRKAGANTVFSQKLSFNHSRAKGDSDRTEDYEGGLGFFHKSGPLVFAATTTFRQNNNAVLPALPSRFNSATWQFNGDLGVQTSKGAVLWGGAQMTCLDMDLRAQHATFTSPLQTITSTLEGDKACHVAARVAVDLSKAQKLPGLPKARGAGRGLDMVGIDISRIDRSHIDKADGYNFEIWGKAGALVAGYEQSSHAEAFAAGSGGTGSYWASGERETRAVFARYQASRYVRLYGSWGWDTHSKGANGASGGSDTNAELGILVTVPFGGGKDRSWLQLKGIDRGHYAAYSGVFDKGTSSLSAAHRIFAAASSLDTNLQTRLAHSAVKVTATTIFHTLIGGTATGSVREDGTLTTSGVLTLTNIGRAVSFTTSTLTGTYGALTIDAAGAWTYTLNNTSPQVQNLNTGQSVTDVLAVTTSDGTSADITITVTGVDDLIITSGTSGITTSGTASGLLAVTFAGVPVQFMPQTNASMPYGAFTIDAAGNWTYTTDSAKPAYQALGDGVTQIDIISVMIDAGSVPVSVGITTQGLIKGGHFRQGRTKTALSINTPIDIAVTLTGINDAPTLSGTPAIVIGENVAYAFTPSSADPDGDTPTFSIFNKPSWASFDTGTGALTGTPSFTDAGVTPGVVIAVSDGVASASLASFNLTVTNVNQIPVASDVTFDLGFGERATFDLGASVFDGETADSGLTVVIISGPAQGGLVFGTATQFTYGATQLSGYFGSDSFTYKVQDPDGGESPVRTVTIINIAENGLDDNPSFSVVPSKTADDNGGGLAFMVVDMSTFATNVNVGAVYSIVADPTGGMLTIDSTTGVLTWLGNIGANTTYSIQVKVTNLDTTTATSNAFDVLVSNTA